MLSLDYRTVLLVAGGIYLLLPLCTWLVLRMPRQHSTLLWCAGGQIGGLGLLLMGLRGKIPDLLSYAAGQPLLALGAVLVAQSLRMEIGRPMSWRLILAGALLYVLTMALLLALPENIRFNALGVFTRLVNLAVVLMLVRAGWMVSQAEGSRNALAIAVAYLVQAVGVVINLANALQGSLDIQTLAGNKTTAISGLMTLLVAFVATMGYLGLTLEKSARRRVALARDLARTQQWHERRDALTRMDRERMLGVLADSLGHQITQPLTAALLRVQMGQRQLASGEKNTSQMLAWLQQAVEDIRRAGEIVERVRNLIRPLPLQMQRVDLAELLGSLQELLRQQAINQGVQLNWELAQPAPCTQGDALQLSHAVLQVLRNALAAAATQPRREVWVSLQAQQGQVLIRVRDSGPGLPAQMLELTSPAGNQQSQTLQGMGLFVAHNIMRNQGGRIELRNNAQGGAEVTLFMPCHRPP